MKKILFFAAVAAIAASCVNENYETEKYVLNASIAETKTALDGVKTNWTPGDELSVFGAAKTNCKFTTAIESASATAAFTYTGAFEVSANTCAFYPYNKSIATTDGVAFTGLEIPEIQTPVENGFDPTAALCFARVQSENVTFQNLTALIKFTIAADDIYNVKVVGTGANLAGAATFDGNALLATEAAAQLKGSMLEGKVFYVAVAPGTFTSLNVYVNGVELTEKARQNKTLVPGKIYDMGQLSNPNTTPVDVEIAEITAFDTKIATSEISWYDEARKKLIADFKEDTFYHNDGYRIYRVANDGKTLTSGDKTVVISDDATWGNETRNGHHYAVLYGKYDPPCYFNIDWESTYKGQAGVYPIVDVQDRRGNHNTLEGNESYYDTNNNKIVIDVLFREGAWASWEEQKFLTAILTLK